MLRSTLFLIAILIAGAVAAQQTSDPAAAAPVVYRNTTPARCDSGPHDANANPVRCGDTAAAVDDGADVADAETGEYTDDAPVYGDATETEYYPGVSLYDEDYWVPGFGFGWPYYAYAPFAFGWPYYGFGFASLGWGWGWSGYGFAWWGGNHHHHDHHGHDHHGWHDHQRLATHSYPGPYRYLGHGSYANQVRPVSGQRMAVRGDRGAMAPRTGDARTVSAPRRGVLPSASYYAMARQGAGSARVMSMNRPAATASRSVTAVNRDGSGRYNRAVATRSEAQRYAVTSLPSRGYAPSNNHGARTMYPASNSYAARGHGAPLYSPPRYGIPNRGYSGTNRAPSYSHASGYAARSAAGPPAPRGGGGSSAHASAGSTHGSSSTPHRH